MVRRGVMGPEAESVDKQEFETWVTFLVTWLYHSAYSLLLAVILVLVHEVFKYLLVSRWSGPDEKRIGGLSIAFPQSMDPGALARRDSSASRWLHEL